MVYFFRPSNIAKEISKRFSHFILVPDNSVTEQCRRYCCAFADYGTPKPSLTSMLLFAEFLEVFFFSSGNVLRRRPSIYPSTMIKLIMRMVFLIQASYVLHAEPFPHLTIDAMTAAFA